MTPIISRIDDALTALTERSDVAVAKAARDTYASALAVLRQMETRAKAIAKTTKDPNERWSEAARIIGAYVNTSNYHGTPGWYLYTSEYGPFQQTVPPGFTKQRVEVWFDFPNAANKRYGGVYVDNSSAVYALNIDGRETGGQVHVVMRDSTAYTEQDFVNPFWFMQNAARIFNNLDSIFVHELTHHWDTMRTKNPKAYQRTVGVGAKAFWSTPEDQPAPAAYYLSVNELNARFMEFTSWCIRMMDISIINAAKDYKSLADGAKKFGKSFADFTGGTEPFWFVQDNIFYSHFSTSAQAFVQRVLSRYYSETDFPRVFNLADPATQRKYTKRLAALWLDLRARAKAASEKIIKRRTPDTSMKRVKIGKGYGYVHK